MKQAKMWRMALALKQGDTSDPTNPVLIFVYQEPRVALDEAGAGFIFDVEFLTYRVVDSAGAEVVPTTAVDLDDAPAGDRTRQGTYAPTIVIAGGAPVGTWRVEWTATRSLTIDPVTFTYVTEFEVVLSAEPIPDGYVTVAQMRGQGVPVAFTDGQIVEAVDFATNFINRVTRRFFEPKFMTRDEDGRGNGTIHNIPDPIIGIEELNVTFSDFRPIARLIDQEQVRIYNRHMRQPGLTEPDDRDSPKIAILRVENPLSNQPRFPPLNRRFQPAQQNIQLIGWFGYTDPDGSPLGRTPALIQRVTMMIAMRNIRPLWQTFGGGAIGGGAIEKEKTRDQDVTFATGTEAGVLSGGWITGDPAIDNILAQYIGPLPMSAV